MSDGARPREWPLVLFTVAVVGSLLWLLALLALSLRSEDRRLELGREKSIGFFDPHFHLSVTAVRELADGELPWLERRGDERLLRITVRSRVDSAEIEIDPSFLRIDLVDGAGRRFAPLVPAGSEHADEADESSDRLSRILGPGESAEQSFLFRLPRDAARPALWIRDSLWIVRLIPGTETSFFHSRTVFALE